VVYHVSAIVEPSVWAFVAAGFASCPLSRHGTKGGTVSGGRLPDRRDRGALPRKHDDPGPGGSVFVLLGRRFIHRWDRILAPLLFPVPYALMILALGHPASAVRVIRTQDVNARARG